MNDTILVNERPEVAERQRELLSHGVVMSHSPRSAQAYAHYRFRGGAQQFNSPTLNDVHVDAVLTNISIGYRNAQMIGSLVFPRVPVNKESDKYFTFDRGAMLRDEADLRAPGAAFERGSFATSTENYSVEEYGIEYAVDDRIRANADSPIELDSLGVQYCVDKVDLKLEKKVKDLVNTSANWTTNATLSGTSQWSDYSNSDPFTDMKTARVTVHQQIAIPANTLVLGYQVFEALALHPDLLDRVKYTGTRERPAMVTAQMMAELFHVEQVLIGMALENTAVEGATTSVSYVWGKHAWLGYVSRQPALFRPSAGYTFTTGRLADRYRDDRHKSDIIRVSEAFDVQKTAAGAGYRIVDAVA